MNSSISVKLSVMVRQVLKEEHQVGACHLGGGLERSPGPAESKGSEKEKEGHGLLAIATVGEMHSKLEYAALTLQRMAMKSFPVTTQPPLVHTSQNTGNCASNRKEKRALLPCIF